jgi:predicted ATP-binding protein involved in virulence
VGGGEAHLATTDDALRLSEFRVRGLFGEFDHHIALKLEDRITAVIAPNGSGKTVCLQLINALFRRQWSVFASTEYAFVEFLFSDGRQIKIEKKRSKEPDEENPAGLPSFTFALQADSKAKAKNWTPKLGENSRIRSIQIERYIPFISRSGPGRWTHDRTGTPYTFQTLVEAFGHRLPANLVSHSYPDEPDLLKDTIARVDCHLIETQRLLIIPDEDPSVYRHERAPPRYAIQEKAQKLKAIIAAQLTDYAALSQSLDRSFPRRVIAAPDTKFSEDLKSSLSGLDQKRKSLMEAGILVSESDDPVALPAGPIAPAIASVLSVYVVDTIRKLSSLDTILSRVTLFKELIEKRFRQKKIEISSKSGFSVSHSGREVPLDKLSSGEQHQLVLFFELLFELKSNALILIDEPELSLHVSWQKQFIADLKRIISLNSFDVVLATHSPQLIGHWEDLVVELGDVDEE